MGALKLGLGKNLILRSKKLIYLLKKQRFIDGLFLRLRYTTLNNNSDEYINILFTVPKKLIKHAVDRNLIRRRIKESFRLNQFLIKKIPNKLYLVELIYSYNSVLCYEKINKEVIYLLNQFNIMSQ